MLIAWKVLSSFTNGPIQALKLKLFQELFPMWAT